MATDCYIKTTQTERQKLQEYIKARFGDTGRVSQGAAVRLLAEEKLTEFEQTRDDEVADE
jgi:hypothetical protein